jgi:hypothetical protein
MTAEQIIAAMDGLSLPELERVFNHALAVQAERKAPHLPLAESDLLARINRGIPQELRARRSFLQRRREDGSISDAEYSELTALSDRVEQLHAERMAALVELARLRGISLPELMDHLGIRFPENV